MSLTSRTWKRLTYSCLAGLATSSLAVAQCNEVPFVTAAPASATTNCASCAVEPALPVNPYTGDLFTRSKLLGDPGCYRSTLAEHGITFDASLTQFYQGVTNGGREQNANYGGKLDYFINVDGQKAGLWAGSFINLHAETRYGRSVNGSAGSLSPVNTAMLFPVPNEDITSITGLKFTQALSENFLLFAGKINTLDAYSLNFSGGSGLNNFMNMSLAFPLSYMRTVPYSTLGAGFAILEDKEPVFSFVALDATNHPTTSGLNDLFADGVVLMAQGILPVNIGGLRGHQSLAGTWSSRHYTLLDKSAFSVVPGEGLIAPTQYGSWSLTYSFDQYLYNDSCNPKSGWGVFGAFGIADAKTSPIAYFLSSGIGGTAPFCSRPNDSWGVGLYYLGLGEGFKNLLDFPVLAPGLAQQNEYGLEAYYNTAITPWCHLTTDLQAIEPSTRSLSTSLVLGLRLKIDF